MSISTEVLIWIATISLIIYLHTMRLGHDIYISVVGLRSIFFYGITSINNIWSVTVKKEDELINISHERCLVTT